MPQPDIPGDEPAGVLKKRHPDEDTPQDEASPSAETGAASPSSSGDATSDIAGSSDTPPASAPALSDNRVGVLVGAGALATVMAASSSGSSSAWQPSAPGGTPSGSGGTPSGSGDTPSGSGSDPSGSGGDPSHPTVLSPPTLNHGSHDPVLLNGSGTVAVDGLATGSTWAFSTDGGKSWTPGTGTSLAAAQLAEGSNQVQVVQIDPAGHRSSAATIEVIKDTQVNAPQLSLTHDRGVSAHDHITDDGTVQINGIEDGATWQYSINGGAWVTGSGSTLASSLFADGEVALRVRQTDKAGNNAEGSLNFTLSRSDPTLDVNGALSGVDAQQVVASLTTPTALFATDPVVNHGGVGVGFTQVRIVETGATASRDDALLSSAAPTTSLDEGAQVTVGDVSWEISRSTNSYTLARADGQWASASEVQALLASLQVRNASASSLDGDKTFTVTISDALGRTAQAVSTVTLDQTPPRIDLNGAAGGLDATHNVVAGAATLLPLTDASGASVTDATQVRELSLAFTSSATGTFSDVEGQREWIGLSEGDAADGGDQRLSLGQAGSLTSTTLVPGRIVTLQLTTGDEGPTLRITADAALTAEQTTLVLNSLRYGSEAGAVQGDREISVTATDIVGNTTDQPARSTVTVLTAGTPLIHLDASADTGASNTDSITRNNGDTARPLILTGTGIPGHTLDLYLDADHSGRASSEERLGTVVCDSVGRWQWTISGSPLADGRYDFIAGDGTAGILSPTFTVTVDTQPPPSSFALGQAVSVRPLLTGVSDPNEPVLVEIDTDNNLTNGYEVRYETHTDDTGHWTLDTATATPTAGTPHTFQNGDTVNARVTNYDTAGNGAVRTDSSTATSSVFDISDSQVIEGVDGTREMVFVVTRSGDMSGTGSVAWSIDQANSSAHDNPEGLASEKDYSGASSGTVTFAAGETQQLVRLTVSGDHYREVNERVVINLQSPSGGDIGDGLGIGNIVEVDMDRLQAAYGLRDLNPHLNTDAIRVRRASDNQEANIGFDAQGNLDTQSLLDFVGTGAGDKGFVTTWYDQSGHGHDMVQTNPDSQGVIVDGGEVIHRSDGSPGISFNTRNGASDDFMVANGVAGSDWQSALLYAKVQSDGTRDGSLFNLGAVDNGRLSAHYPASWKNYGYVFDVGDIADGRLSRSVPGGAASLIDHANDVVFEAHSANKTAGTAEQNYTDAAQAIFENGIEVTADATVPGSFSTTAQWQLARHSEPMGTRDPYYQEVTFNEFMVYLAQDNSAPDPQSLTGTSGRDVLTYSGEHDVTRIDGLAGDDMLYLSGAVDLDFGQVSRGVTGIEQVWMQNGQANTVTLTRDTLALNGASSLTVTMDEGDAVILDGVRMNYDAQHRQTLIIGSNGNDVLFGTSRNDVYIGGAGADIFTWRAQQGGEDTVMDYSAAQGDTLDLTALLPGITADQTSQFLRKTVDDHGDVVLRVDWHGTGHFDQPDLTIRLQGLQAVDAITVVTAAGQTVL